MPDSPLTEKSHLDRLRAAREALSAEPAGGAGWADAGAEVLSLLTERYGLTSYATAVDEGIELAEHMLLLLPAGDGLRETVALNLAVDYTERYRLAGRRPDLERAIALGRDIMAGASAALRPLALNNLAARLLASWQYEDEPDHLAEAVDLLEEALAATDTSSEERTHLELNLGAALSSRGDYNGSEDDHERAIALTRAAAARLPLAARGGAEAHLSSMLVDTYRRGAAIKRLDEGLAYARLAAKRPGTRLERALRLQSLAQVCLSAFEVVGELELLREAEAAIKRGRRVAPREGLLRPGLLATHAAVAFTIYEQNGERAALDRAIGYAREATRWPNLSPGDQARFANQLCVLLTERFQLVGNRVDVDDAVALVDSALTARLDVDAEPALRTNVAHALHSRFLLDNGIADLHQAIEQVEKALSVTAAHSRDRASRLDAASSYYHARAELRRDSADLQRSIDLARVAVATVDLKSPARTGFLSNLATRLDTRAEWLHSRADLEEAIALLEEAHRAAGTATTNAARIAFTLAGRYAFRYQRYTADVSTDDIKRAADLWKAVCAQGEPSLTVYAAQHLGNAAFASGRWRDCEDALSLSLEAARQQTRERRSVSDRERARFDVQGTAAVAALAAVRASEPGKGLLHLEQAAATLLAAAAGQAAEEVVAEDVFAATDRLSAPIVYVAATRAGTVAIAAYPNRRVVWRELPLTVGEVEAALSDLRAAFTSDQQDDPLPAWAGEVEKLLNWTHDRLARAIGELAAGAARVAVVPVGRLAALPIAAARAPGAAALIEQLVVLTLPNARAAAFPSPRPATHSVLIAADAGPPERFCEAVDEEADALALVHPKATLWRRRRRGHGQPARQRRLRTHGSRSRARSANLPRSLGEAVREATLVHLACHVDLDFDDPMQSTLELGRPLPLVAVARRTASGAHYVLSACDAGLSGTRLPDEAIGPATVLLHAGARSVCAALWPIDDQLAPQFMAIYHRHLAAGSDPALALTLAQRACREEVPVVWAAFAHFGA